MRENVAESKVNAEGRPSINARARTRARRVLATLLLTIITALALVGSGVLPVPADAFRGLVEARLHTVTGVHLELNGPVTVRLGPRFGLQAGDIAIVDPDGGQVVEVAEVAVRLGFFALIGGRVHVHRALATGLQIDYCGPWSAAFGADAPVAAAPSPEPPPEIVIDTLRIEELMLRCGSSPPDAVVTRIDASAPGGEALRVDLTGSAGAAGLELTAHGGQLEQLLGGSNFPFDVDITSELGSVALDGSLRLLGDDIAADAVFKLDVPDPPALGRLLGVEVPPAGPAHVDGALSSDLISLQLNRLSGAFGETAFSGSGRADFASERARLELSASLQQLDLSPFLSTPESTGGNTAANVTEWKIEEALGVIRAFDASLALIVDQVLGLRAPLDTIALDATLKDGLIDVVRASANSPLGNLQASASLDSRMDCPRLEIAATLNELDVAGVRTLGVGDIPLTGNVSGTQINLTSCAGDRQSLINTAAGEMTITGARLRMDDGLAILFETIKVVATPEEDTHVEAFGAIADAPVELSLVMGPLSALAGDQAWPLHLRAAGAGSALSLGGSAQLLPGRPAFDLALEFQAAQAGSLSAWADLAADAELPLTARGQLRMAAGQFSAEDILLQAGDSALTGSAVWSYRGEAEKLVLRLRSDSLNLDSLNELLPAAAEAPAIGEQQDAPLWEGLPPTDLDIYVGSIGGAGLDVQELGLSGHLEAGMIEAARLNLLLGGELSLQGELDLDARQLPARLAVRAAADNLGLSDLLSELGLADGLRMRADRAAFSMTSSGFTLRDIASRATLAADLSGFAWDLPGTGGYESKDMTQIRLEEVNVSSALGQPIIAHARGEIDAVSTDLWVRAPALSRILQERSDLPLIMALGADEDVLLVDLLVDRSADERLRAEISVSGQSIPRDTGSWMLWSNRWPIIRLTVS